MLDSLLIAAHRQAWREEAPPLALSLVDLAAILPRVFEDGSVGLVWPRLRHRAAEYGAAGLALADAYQQVAARRDSIEPEIAQVGARLQSAGITPVLFKGWAVARCYPASAVRTTGDIDLVVPDNDYMRAIELLTQSDGEFGGVVLALHDDAVTDAHLVRTPVDGVLVGMVDLHSFSRWGEVADPGFFQDAVSVAVGGGAIHVPRVEDHLRALCLHFLRHAAVRPARLCDIALLAELRPAEFDWDRCLRGAGRRADHVTVVLALARELLGACLDGTPAEVRTARAPKWLTRAVIRHWVTPPPVLGNVLPEVLADPRGIIRTFTKRWPDPITATYDTNAPLETLPRGVVQAAAYGKRIAGFLASRLPLQLEQRRAR